MPTHRDLPPEETHRSTSTTSSDLSDRVHHARRWVTNNPQYAVAIAVGTIALIVFLL